MAGDVVILSDVKVWLVYSETLLLTQHGTTREQRNGGYFQGRGLGADFNLTSPRQLITLPSYIFRRALH